VVVCYNFYVLRDNRYSTTPNTIQLASWILGRVYDNDELTGVWTTGEDMIDVPVIPAQYGWGECGGQTGFFERSKPRYEDVDANSIYIGEHACIECFLGSHHFIRCLWLGRGCLK
jgi:hypothetical protein